MCSNFALRRTLRPRRPYGSAVGCWPSVGEHSLHAAGADRGPSSAMRCATFSHFNTHNGGRIGSPSIADDAADPRSVSRPGSTALPRAAAFAAHPALSAAARQLEIFLSPTDRRAREPRDLGDRRPAHPAAQNLAGCEHPPPPLVDFDHELAVSRRIACVWIMPTCILPQRHWQEVPPESHHYVEPGRHPSGWCIQPSNVPRTHRDDKTPCARSQFCRCGPGP